MNKNIRNIVWGILERINNAVCVTNNDVDEIMELFKESSQVEFYVTDEDQLFIKNLRRIDICRHQDTITLPEGVWKVGKIGIF